MKNNPASHSGQSLRILLFFCIAVVLLIGISFTAKIVVTLGHSSFDGKHRFTLVIFEKNPSVISFDPSAQTISLLRLHGVQKTSKSHLANILHTPIDGYVIPPDKNMTLLSGEDEKIDLAQSLQTIFFSLSRLQTDVTFVDVFRLWLLAKSTGEQETVVKTLPAASVEQTDPAIIDKTASSLFGDETLVEENKSIQVVNATGVSGIGSEFAQVLSNIGANVVAVSTARSDSEKTSIQFSGEPSYTVARVEKILQVKATRLQKAEIYDVIITIGKNKVSLLKE